MSIYIYAKIGSGNALASRYLNGDSEVNFPALPIYFDCSFDNEEDFLRSGDSKGQGELFFECGRSPEDKYIVVVHEASVFILRPSGKVVFKKSIIRDDKSGYVKILPVEILAKKPVADVPAVLASIGANRYYSSGTFREISGVGNIRAIQSMLGQEIAIPIEPSISHAIECLGSVEFETLVAKIFEEAGCFVPAYRGGVMASADIFVYNKTKAEVSIGRVCIDASARKSIQVKLRADTNSPPPGVDFLVACNVKEAPNLLGVEWLKSALSNCTMSRRWLIESLEWAPLAFVRATCGAL